MLQFFLQYHHNLTTLLREPSPHHPWRAESTLFHRLLLHLQYERLIHLIVTMTTGLAFLLCGLMTLFNPNIYLIVIDVILMVLFLAYLNHYRILENTIQGFYPTFTKLRTQLLKNEEP